MWRIARCVPVTQCAYLWSRKHKPNLARHRVYASLKAFRVTVIYSPWTNSGWSVKACATRFMVITSMECRSRLEQQLVSLSLSSIIAGVLDAHSVVLSSFLLCLNKWITLLNKQKTNLKKEIEVNSKICFSIL